jgi:hypothetical protein
MMNTANCVMRRCGAIVLLAAAVLLGGSVHAQSVYATPQAAADALVSAIATGDNDALRRILGPDFRYFIPQDSVSRDDVYAFLGAWAKHQEIVNRTPSKAELVVGQNDWHLPTPMVKSDNGWRFDLREGHEEMRRRRIDRNETAAIQTLQMLCAAQEKYRSSVGNGRSASRIVSSPGRHDGLFWPADSQAPEPSPLTDDALIMGPDVPADAALHGYRYEVLPAQADAGCAFAAWPATYDVSGRYSFMIGPDNKVVQRDFGWRTSAAEFGARARADSASWAAAQP